MTLFLGKTQTAPGQDPPVGLKRDRLQTKRKRNIIKKMKNFDRSKTLKSSLSKKFGHNKRSHKEQGVLQILKGIDKPSYKETRGERKVW